MSTSVNPYTQKAGTHYSYYYYNVPGTYTFSFPAKGVSLYCVIAGGGGTGGAPGALSNGGCQAIQSAGGGGGGGGGQVLHITHVSSGSNMTIVVGDYNQPSTIEYNGTKNTANCGENGKNGTYVCTDRSATTYDTLTTTGGSGGTGGDSNAGGVGGQSALSSTESYRTYYNACTGGAAGTGNSGGGGGSAAYDTNSESQPKPGGAGGIGTNISFYDGTGSAYVNPGGKGGQGYCGKNGTALTGDSSTKGAVLIYFYFDGCWSPFSYFDPSGTTLFLSENIVKIRGQYTLEGYTTPSANVCMYWPKTTCRWTGWQGLVLSCSTDWSNWCCCWTIPGVPLYPDIHFDLRCDLPLTLQVTQEGYKVPAITPISQIFTTYILIGNADLYFDVHVEGISDDTFILKLIANPTYVECNDNIYSSVVALPTWEYKIDSGLYTYEANISADLEFCADPESEDMWINCPLYITLHIYDNVTKITTYKNSWVINVKIAEVV